MNKRKWYNRCSRALVPYSTKRRQQLQYSSANSNHSRVVLQREECNKFAEELVINYGTSCRNSLEGYFSSDNESNGIDIANYIA